MGEQDLTEQRTVGEQYATTDRLATRLAVWRPAPGEVDAKDAIVAAVAAAGPRDVLDIGCGTGDLTRRIADALPGACVIGIDNSAAMAAATRERGLTAHVASAGALPFEDATFDVVTASWMLYHVPDLDRALSEIVRVLRPGGRAVLTTNSESHLADLMADAGLAPLPLPFSRENAVELLRRHFARVTSTDHPSLAHFETAADAERYLATFPHGAGATVRSQTWPRDYRGLATVLTCGRP